VHHLHDPGWAASVTGRFGHYVSADAVRAVHYSRPTGFGDCGIHGFIDEQGLNDGVRLPHCPDCQQQRANHGRWPC
jgi:hypothetical protein